jgi:hypothetical protein
MLIKPEKVLMNKAHIFELMDLLIALKKEAYEKHPATSTEIVDWAIEQAILRTSLKDGVEFDMI